MKVVVIGGTGLIGSKVVARLGDWGHEAIAAAPNTGVNTLTGEGLDLALEGASAVVDVAQEQLITSSAIPYSLVHATQFFEFLGAIAQSATDDAGNVHIAPVRFQPIAAGDVAEVVAEVSIGTPLGGRIEIAGPESYRFDEVIGAELSQDSVVPEGKARLGARHLAQWLKA